MKTKPTRLGCESLETREMPASVTFGGGVVTVTGTEQSDRISIHATAAGKVRVTEYNSNSDLTGTMLGQFSNVNKIVFNGKGGADIFNNLTAIKLVADGGAGNDVIRGGKGNDEIRGGADNDELYGGIGNDKLYGDAGSDSLYDALTLAGGGANAGVVQEGGTNYLYGGTGADTLVGASGIDYLDGGKDSVIDKLTGGSGADTFVHELFKITPTVVVPWDMFLDFDAAIDKAVL